MKLDFYKHVIKSIENGIVQKKIKKNGNSPINIIKNNVYPYDLIITIKDFLNKINFKITFSKSKQWCDCITNKCSFNYIYSFRTNN